MGFESDETFSQEKDDTPNMQSLVPPSDGFREGGYGWVCVACTFLMNAHTWGINAVRQGDISSLTFIKISLIVSQ
jgi:hypothetical protein